MNHPAHGRSVLADIDLPHRGYCGEAINTPAMSSVVENLYAVISVLDSVSQSDFAGRLHALTLEIRERAAQLEGPKYS